MGSVSYPYFAVSVYHDHFGVPSRTFQNLVSFRFTNCLVIPTKRIRILLVEIDHVHRVQPPLARACTRTHACIEITSPCRHHGNFSVKAAMSSFVYFEKKWVNFPKSSLTIHVNLLHAQPFSFLFVSE